MINIIDSSKDAFGHNHLYIDSLKKIKDVQLLGLDITLLPNNANILRFLLNRYVSFKKQLKASSPGIAHFLHADLYYPVPFVFPFSRADKKVIFTMHYMPVSALKKRFLKNYCNKADAIVVHSEYLCDQYRELGLKNVRCIEYPSFYDYSTIADKATLREKMGIPEGKYVFSCLGGTRYEKGLDILIEALNQLPQEFKKKTILNVVGPGFDFLKSDIESRLDPAIDSRLILQGVSDEEFMENVKVTDYMIIPYRRNFNGNSGPLTEAICNDVPSIVADHGNLGYLTKKYNFGKTFQSENIESLNQVIKDVLTNNYDFDFSFKKRLTEDNFIAGYQELYNQILSNTAR